MIQRKENPFGTVFGYGDSTGGTEVAVFPSQGGGALLIVSGGYDYGSWFEKITQITEQQYQELQVLCADPNKWQQDLIEFVNSLE